MHVQLPAALEFYRARLSRDPAFPVVVPLCLYADYHDASATGIIITARIPYGIGTFGSRATAVGGTAMYLAIQNLKDKMKLIAAHLHDGSLLHFANKRVTNLDEIKGQKVRAPTRIGSKFLASLGASPVQMPVPQPA